MREHEAQAPSTRRGPEDWAGLFDSVAECDASIEEIEGRLPDGLAGTLVRNGPGKRDFAQSFFDGDGMIRALRFGRDGAVHLRARFVRTAKWLAERGSDRPLRRLAGTNLPGGVLRNAFRVPAYEANTHVVPLANGLFALHEGGHPTRIDPETLDTLGLTDFDGALSPRTLFTAHPHVDPETGDVLAFGTHLAGRRPELRALRIDGQGRLSQVGTIPLAHASFVHDYALSKRWMAFFLPPLVASLPRFLLGLAPFFDAITWRPELGMRVALLPRAGGAPVVLETDACMAGHVVGARDEGDELVVDLCRLASWDALAADARRPRATDWGCYASGAVWRYRIDPRARRVQGEPICPLPAEFPRIDPRREAVGARFAYFAASPREGEGGWFHAILKLDLQRGTTELFDFGARSATHEPVFVPRPGRTDEDDGWLLATVHDGAKQETFFAVLDARRVGDGPICTLRPHRNLGITFHGSWIAG